MSGLQITLESPAKITLESPAKLRFFCKRRDRMASKSKGSQLEVSVVVEPTFAQEEVSDIEEPTITVEAPDNMKAKVVHYGFKEVKSKTNPEVVEGLVAVPKVFHFPGAKYWVTFQAAPGQKRGIFNRFAGWRKSLWDIKFEYHEGGRNLNCHIQAAGESFKTLKEAEAKFFEVVGSKPEKHFV